MSKTLLTIIIISTFLLLTGCGSQQAKNEGTQNSGDFKYNYHRSEYAPAIENSINLEPNDGPNTK